MKKQNQIPANANGNASIVNSNCPAKNQSVNPPRTSRACKNRKNSNETNPCLHSHNKFGKKITTETNTPNHNHPLRKYLRISVNSTPTTTPHAKNPIVYFASIPNPIPAPTPIHHLSPPFPFSILAFRFSLSSTLSLFHSFTCCLSSLATLVMQ